MKTLSDDVMQGREWGTDGNARARAYIKRMVAEMNGGIEPEEHAFTRTVTRRGQTRDVSGTNLIVTLPGRNPDGPVLEITAHFDHIGVTEDGQIYNGADDNASGVGALFSILKSFREKPPQHEVKLVFLDTEEVGLAGAYEYVAAHLDDRPRVNINLDMIAQNEDGEIYAAGTHHTPELKPIIEEAAKGLGLTVIFGNDAPSFGANDWSNSSDHAAFHAVGIPFIYLGVADHPHYHRITDTFETIPLDVYRRVVQLTVNTAHALDDNLDAIAKPRRVASTGS
jgi:Zn-dependent M28 family amino/carboxypeptidase